MPLYIGLMSGTSVDGVDAVLTRIEDGQTEVLARHEQPIPASLHADIINALATGSLSAHAYWMLDAHLGELFAVSVQALLEANHIDTGSVHAIGSHGQTIFHAPNDSPPLTVQAGDPNIIAARTGITTVADFRRRDVALGGQGAPLAPAFHRALFFASGERRAIVNIGGIANVSVLPPTSDEPVLGFDSGPGNTLMDLWCQRHRDEPFDRDGAWAVGGRLHEALLATMEADPYFSRSAPKSTGREYFNMAWLEGHLDKLGESVPARDVQHTLLVLGARSIAGAIDALDEPVDAVYLCGGGALNNALCEALHRRMGNIRLETTIALGMHPKDVEGAAFAWLAYRTLNARTGNAPSVTGARRESVLGAIYPGADALIKY